MTTADAITLFDHEDGHRSMKLGRYDDTTSEEIEIVELENPVPKATMLANWELSDFPERVLEFFNLNGNGGETDE